MTQPIKGILFDLDDTLIDWSGFLSDWATMESRHLGRIYSYLSEQARPLTANLSDFVTAYRSFTMEAWAEARSTLRAPHMLKVMETVLGQFGFVPDEAISIKTLMDVYGWGAVEGVKVFPDVPEVLPKLLEKGIALGIITNASQPMWIRIAELDDFGLTQYFTKREALISAADSGYLKPHPEIFRFGLSRLGTNPEETLYVGDNTVADIAGAQGVGMRAVLRIKHPAPPLISGLIVPDAAINDFHDLLRLVEDWDAYLSESNI